MKTENVEKGGNERQRPITDAYGETGTEGQANTEPPSEDNVTRGMLDDWMRGDDSDNPADPGSTVEPSTKKKANSAVAGDESESDNVFRD
ncbi:MAG TPA: hypothetical protein VN937_17535 [Blastocatellia bacterium]|nr:hypothetical protein [Blastocatellia bacterium]